MLLNCRYCIFNFLLLQRRHKCIATPGFSDVEFVFDFATIKTLMEDTDGRDVDVNLNPGAVEYLAQYAKGEAVELNIDL